MIELRVTNPHELPESAIQGVIDYLKGFLVATEQYVPPAPTVAPIRLLEQSTPPVVVPINPVPPVPVATTAPVNPFAPTAAGIDVDASGLPWDGRIHASTRVKVEDGTWRKRRGVSDETVAAVTAELKKTMGLPSTIIAPPPAVVLVPSVATAAPVVAVPPAPFAAPAVPPAPPTTTIVPPVVGIAPTATSPSSPVPGATSDSHPTATAPTFPMLMQAITKAYGAGQLTQEKIQAAVQAAGMASLPMVASRPDMIPTVAAGLGLLL